MYKYFKPFQQLCAALPDVRRAAWWPSNRRRLANTILASYVRVGGISLHASGWGSRCCASQQYNVTGVWINKQQTSHCITCWTLLGNGAVRNTTWIEAEGNYFRLQTQLLCHTYLSVCLFEYSHLHAFCIWFLDYLATDRTVCSNFSGGRFIWVSYIYPWTRKKTMQWTEFNG